MKGGCWPDAATETALPDELTEFPSQSGTAQSGTEIECLRMTARYEMRKVAVKRTRGIVQGHRF